MALSGIRDMSVIEEAPQDRRPIQTYVIEHNEGVIAQAISKEPAPRRTGILYPQPNRHDIHLRAEAGETRTRSAHRRGARQDNRAGAQRDMAAAYRGRDRRAGLHNAYRNGRRRFKREHAHNRGRRQTGAFAALSPEDASADPAGAHTHTSHSAAARCFRKRLQSGWRL